MPTGHGVSGETSATSAEGTAQSSDSYWWAWLLFSPLLPLAIAGPRLDGTQFSALGTALTVLYGGIAIIVAIAIYRRQARMIARQDETVLKLSQRLFGSLGDFPAVYEHVLGIIRDANASPTSELAVMFYWLWFGADRKVATSEAQISSLQAYDSEVRSLLHDRLVRGLSTLVVTYDPVRQKNKLQRFLKSLFEWWDGRSRGNKEVTGAFSVSDQDIDGLIERYEADIKALEAERTKRSKTRFEALSLKDEIPMLMVAGRIEGSWRGLIYLGETEALSAGARTGGFHSEDAAIAEVIMEQIRAVARRAS